MQPSYTATYTYRRVINSTSAVDHVHLVIPFQNQHQAASWQGLSVNLFLLLLWKWQHVLLLPGLCQKQRLRQGYGLAPHTWQLLLLLRQVHLSSKMHLCGFGLDCNTVCKHDPQCHLLSEALRISLPAQEPLQKINIKLIKISAGCQSVAVSSGFSESKL